MSKVDEMVGTINHMEMAVRNIFGQIFAHIGNNKILTAPNNIDRGFDLIEERFKIVNDNLLENTSLVLGRVAVVSGSIPTQKALETVFG
ncbi:MAG: hypothetical protein UW41_C0025G0018 [Candidatus Collierbacteria bacterium GW2011_GWC2_44_18]|uniref:Uncharacterized protein n=1 Tax=Candidatus Collierbacteria bacterium GW2011_GWC2_44_18 TaxID=1618392 RepID=A0A0G1JX99_9BACT|nr:MAG: hypothetical protein UW41_C0025G0018 [Candidatus Collierbacteria bacterium GW2011_GWC2_44_18]